jgi:hypothetical protein
MVEWALETRSVLEKRPWAEFVGCAQAAAHRPMLFQPGAPAASPARQAPVPCCCYLAPILLGFPKVLESRGP